MPAPLPQLKPTTAFLHNAIVTPISSFDIESKTFDGGVFYETGDYCALSEQIKQTYKNSPGEQAPKATVKKEGLFLYGGMLQNRHFGHFLIESLCRLWAAEYIRDIDGIVFMLRSPQAEIAAFVHKVVDLIAPGIPLVIVSEPTQFETLLVPSALCHPLSGALMGHEMNKRQFDRLRIHDKTFPKKLYVSRSRLPAQLGLLLTERYLEKCLEEEGYTVIHPQELTIEQQLAYYTNAEQLIFADGSAFHLYAMVAEEKQNVFIVWRRKKTGMFQTQLRSFTGASPKGEIHLKGFYVTDKNAIKTNRLRALPDYNTLSAELHKEGFISTSQWGQPEEALIQNELNALSGLQSSEHSFMLYDDIWSKS